MNTSGNPIPWHLIAKQWRNGSSLDALSKRYSVSIDDLKKRLATAYDSERLDIRSNAQIHEISSQVKSDLVTALARISKELATKDDLSLRDAPALDRLIQSAARLFAWPSPKPVESNFGLTANTSAINLALIRTTPDQLKALSEERSMHLESNHTDNALNAPFLAPSPSDLDQAVQ